MNQERERKQTRKRKGMKTIRNKIYGITFSVDKTIHVDTFHINKQYRGRHYSIRIFNNLIKQYDKPVTLECFHTLLPFYRKLGFTTEHPLPDGYFAMTLHAPAWRHKGIRPHIYITARHSAPNASQTIMGTRPRSRARLSPPRTARIPLHYRIHTVPPPH